jgi:hypothetical protein
METLFSLTSLKNENMGMEKGVGGQKTGQARTATRTCRLQTVEKVIHWPFFQRAGICSVSSLASGNFEVGKT